MARGHPVLARLPGHALPRSMLGADCGKAIEKMCKGAIAKRTGWGGWLRATRSGHTTPRSKLGAAPGDALQEVGD